MLGITQSVIRGYKALNFYLKLHVLEIRCVSEVSIDFGEQNWPA